MLTFPQGLPADVLCELGKAQVDEIRGQMYSPSSD
jgi:hypothetical protein